MTTRTIRNVVVGVVLALALGGLARAEDVKVPETAQEHLALAKQYDEKAAVWRDEAAHHREMADTYKKYSKLHPNPSVTKMEQHCSAIVKEADKLALEAENLAKDHRQAAKELEGKK